MSAQELHYSVVQLAKLWNLTPVVVRNLFRDRTDVFKIGHSESISKRGYVTLRIPYSVAHRVYAELCHQKL